MDTDGLSTQMEMSMKDSGKMILLMVMVNISTWTVQPTLGNGLTTNRMAMARKIGMMGLNTRDSSRMEKNLDLGNSFGKMDPVTRGNSMKIRFQGMELTFGVIKGSM